MSWQQSFEVRARGEGVGWLGTCWNSCWPSSRSRPPILLAQGPKRVGGPLAAS